MSSDELEDLLVAYALGAVDDTDRQLVEERVAWDPAARARLAELEDTVRLAAHELGPPDHVWDRLAGAVFPGEPRVPHPRRLVNRATQRTRRARRVLAGLGAAACLAALVTGIVLAAGGSSPAPNLSVAARTAQTTPGARVADLDRPDGTVAATVVVLPNGSGFLSSRLRTLATGRTYQLWAQTPNGAVSLGVLGPSPHVVAFTLVGAATRVVVTNEAAGGVPESHQTPTATGDLPAE
jgi:hypothetical protein